MKDYKKVILNILKKNVRREDKFENQVLNLALKKMNGAQKDTYGVYYSKSGKRILMADKAIEGEYVVADGTVAIDDNAFWGCAFLNKITLPNTITSIGDEVFGRCLSLKGLVIPKSVAHIGDNPFVGLDAENLKCESEAYVIVNKMMFTADKKTLVACLNDDAIVNIPEGVENIGAMSFRRRRSLKKVTIPQSVKTISTDAFADCDALVDIVIPASVSTIEDYAFAECDMLKKVSFLGEVKHLSRTILSDCDELKELSVPAGKASRFIKMLHLSETESVIVMERELTAAEKAAKEAKKQQAAAAEAEKKAMKEAKKEAKKDVKKDVKKEDKKNDKKKDEKKDNKPVVAPVEAPKAVAPVETTEKSQNKVIPESK